MKIKGKVGDGHNQLWWVVLLLAIAVILPTICLLWFMGQAVKNDRLAVRQKLSDFYQQRLETLSTRLDELWSARINFFEQQTPGSHHSEIFNHLTGSGENDSKVCDAVIIYDDKARPVYPLTGTGEYSEDMPEEFNTAWSAEFIDADFRRAEELYERIAVSGSEDYIRYSALMGRIRCLRKLGETERTITLCREMAYGGTPEDIGSSSVSLITRARILLVELKSETGSGPDLSDVRELLDSAIDYTPGDGSGFLPMPSETRVFFLRKAIELAEKSPWAGQLDPEISRARRLLSTEELAAAFLDKYDSGTESQTWSEDAAVEMVTLLRQTLDQVEAVEGNWSAQLRSWTEPLKQQMSMVLDSFQAQGRRTGSVVFEKSALATLLELWPQDSFRRLELPQAVFGMYHSIGDRTYLLLQKHERLGSDFDLCSEEVEDLGISYRITDNAGTGAWGLENPQQEAFLQVPLGRFFPGWHAAIHFTDVDIFEKTAARQKVIYMWAGLLAIFVMIAAGTLAARVVGRQIKVNKLKNDFIATVSHELKTPLASMRVLVDTLLEGNYRNQQQVTEYLELVSKENERLTGLIDNFLTFSRMERNKQAFSMSITNPAVIARDAAEAVKTKFSKGRCGFELSIAEDVPNIQADRDAMVTVLVNLLDNAYKYSYDDKRIELKVYVEDGSVCFCVSDNGAGMSRRAIRKIFKRFYQADRSLARRAEGCGLGLSITKFIVDAHRGSISVESKPGEGSVFTVRLPAGG